MHLKANVGTDVNCLITPELSPPLPQPPRRRLPVTKINQRELYMDTVQLKRGYLKAEGRWHVKVTDNSASLASNLMNKKRN